LQCIVDFRRDVLVLMALMLGLEWRARAGSRARQTGPHVIYND
jgi:hypothetical protein